MSLGASKPNRISKIGRDYLVIWEIDFSINKLNYLETVNYKHKYM